MRDAAFAVMRRVGVETGGSNVQFAVNPENGDMVVIEMNPRVSRSSALASKATGFPIAKIAARLAVGYTLDEIPNDITKMTPASFEPTIDYVVTKIPRWAFEKFPGTSGVLGTQMQSVGEVMAIGGIEPIWTGRAMAFIFISRNAGPHFRSVHKVVRSFLDNAPFRRIEASVDVGFAEGARWMKMLGFELEGYMRAYRPDGSDMLLYAKVKEWHSSYH
jgi:hypothetical protein